MTRPDEPMRVLVAVDGSAPSMDSLALVNGIDWPADTTVDVVAVVHPVAPVGVDPWAFTAMPWTSTSAQHVAQVEAEFQRHARELVDGARSRLTAVSRRVETAVLDGRPAVAILDRAHTTRADLIVVGSRGHSTISTMLLGSVSTEVIDHADRPVMVARSASMKRVAVAVDGSQAAAHAASLITDWSIFSGASVLVVSVAPLPPPWWTGLRDRAIPGAIDSLDELALRSHDYHERLAVDVANQLREHGIHAEPLRREGDPAPEILGAAASWRADLIVMGTRGQKGMKRAFLGSVARNVLSNTSASVLIPRQPALLDAATSSAAT